VPLPGAEVKLSPVPDGYEIRARGPMVTPGYFGRPDLTAQAFDEEGFYRTGDAVRLLDEDHPERGLAFRGRLAGLVERLYTDPPGPEIVERAPRPS
jgi:feruloyl-CoA synthase